MTGISRRRFGVSVGALAVSTFTFGKARATNLGQPKDIRSPPTSYDAAEDGPSGPTPSAPVQLYELQSMAIRLRRWTFGDPLKSVMRTDIMPAAYDASAVTKKAKLLNFFTIADIHITNKDLPIKRSIFNACTQHCRLALSISGMMLYTTHVLGAAVQTINALHKKDPFDFGVSLGDACNSTQYNELRWYIDVLDGEVITPVRRHARSRHHRISESLQGGGA